MTDTNQASELFELCKKVYELTSWKDTHSRLDDGNHTIRNEGNEVLLGSKQAPLYTSDYLLEKLVGNVGVEKIYSGQDVAYIAFSIKLKNTPREWRLNSGGNTPLKALLKLTIALSEAGELK